MPLAIKVIGFAGQVACPIAGQYLKSFDFEAENGLGFGVFTTRIEEALAFPSIVEASEFWKRQSKVKPRRTDGRPNRPLTATTVTFERIP
jgi:hypothetical protein